MSLLLNLLKALDEEEIDLLRNELILKGKESQIFDYTLQQLNKKRYSKAEVMETIGVTSTHFDKINNVLLRKCYHLLAGEGTELLLYLEKKLLDKHLLHEIKLQEKSILQKKEAQYYYNTFFEAIVNLPAKYFREQQAKLYGEKLLKICNYDKNTEAYIKCRIIYAKLNVIRHGKPTESLVKEIKSQLDSLVELDEQKKLNTKTQLWLHKTLAFYYIRIEKNYNKHYENLLKIKHLYEINDQLPLKEKAVNECNIASHNYDTNNLNKAFNCYKDAFNKYSYLLENELPHLARYIELCILLSEFKLAEKLYKKRLAKFLENEHEAHGVLAALTYSKYLIHCSKYKHILPVIQKGRIINSRMIYYKYDIELRMLENLVFALRKDFDYALELAFKNLKFIASQGLSIRKFLHAHFFRLLISVMYLVKEKVPISHQSMRFYKEYQQGELLIYGLLIDKIKKRAEK